MHGPLQGSPSFDAPSLWRDDDRRQEKPNGQQQISGVCRVSDRPSLVEASPDEASTMVRWRRRRRMRDGGTRRTVRNLCAGPGSSSGRDVELSVEHNGELSFGFAPLPRRHFPFRGDISQDEVEQFDRCFVGWKMAARFYGATQLRVQGFDCVGGVDDPPDRDGERKERDDLGPIAPPALGNRGNRRPHGPTSNVLSAASPASASFAR